MLINVGPDTTRLWGVCTIVFTLNKRAAQGMMVQQLLCPAEPSEPFCAAGSLPPPPPTRRESGATFVTFLVILQEGVLLLPVTNT